MARRRSSGVRPPSRPVTRREEVEPLRRDGGASRRRLSHVDGQGRVKMVDVGAKPATAREATARGHITISPEALGSIRAGRIAKGDPLQAARLAGIMAAKRTSDLIPLCHPLPLTHVELSLSPTSDGYDIEATARTTAQTGVEMEALTAVSVAALTVYDMVKALDKAMVIGNIRLMKKTGGKSGTWTRAHENGKRKTAPHR